MLFYKYKIKPKIISFFFFKKYSKNNKNDFKFNIHLFIKSAININYFNGLSILFIFRFF